MVRRCGPAPPRPLTRICWPSFTPTGILTSICSPVGTTTRRVPPRAASSKLIVVATVKSSPRVGCERAAPPASAEKIGEDVFGAETFLGAAAGIVPGEMEVARALAAAAERTAGRKPPPWRGSKPRGLPPASISPASNLARFSLSPTMS